MKIAIISPISGLEEWSILSTLHLVLAQIDDQRYVDFYKKRRAAGDTLILDNGAYEGKLVSDERLWEMVQEYDPQVVVLPDLPFQSPRANLYRAHLYFDKYQEVGRQYMFVPQTHSTDLKSFLDQIITATVEFRHPWIGLSRLLHQARPAETLDFVSLCELRGCLCVLIKQLMLDAYVHALGMFGTDPLSELYHLRRAGVDSLDTGSPIWRGWCDCSYSDKWTDIPLDFHTKTVPSSRDLISTNLEAVLR